MKSTNEVMMRTNDLAATKAHYHSVLGFPIVMETAHVVGFDMGSFNLYFELGDDNGAVFEFQVADVARAKAELLEVGCTLVEENPAIPRCYMRDPFGVLFNLTAAEGELSFDSSKPLDAYAKTATADLPA